MKRAQRLTAIIEREDDGFVALCPNSILRARVASIEEARSNLIETLTLFFETASHCASVKERLNRILFRFIETPVRIHALGD